MAAKILIKLLMLAMVLAGLNFVYNATLYKKDLKAQSAQAADMMEMQATTDVFYFGESSDFTFRDTDSTKRSISDLASSFFPALKFSAINKPATHAGIYKGWLRQIDAGAHKPQAVVITLNMRSFDAAWINSKLETPLQESAVLTRPYPNLLNRFFLSLQVYDHKTAEQREQDMLKDWETRPLVFPFPFKYKTLQEWNKGMGEGGYLKADGSWDFDKIGLACHYIKAYAFNIDNNNPRVKDFDEIAHWCEENKIHLYLNLMAENTAYADSLVGKELVFLMKQNRDFLVKRYNTSNCTVVDNLELVKGSDYIDRTWTTEHYGYRGRMAIAKHLAAALHTQFSTAYQNAY